METKDRSEELIEKIKYGLVLSHKKLFETTKRNNEELVILQDDKIVRIKPR